MSKIFELRKTIKLTFLKIGVRCDMIGFNYFCDAVEFAIKNPKLLGKLCYGLYEMVGVKYQVKNTTSVERSMRHALETCYEKKIHTKNFIVFDVYSKPTVGEVIRAVVEGYMHGRLK